MALERFEGNDSDRDRGGLASVNDLKSLQKENYRLGAANKKLKVCCKTKS